MGKFIDLSGSRFGHLTVVPSSMHHRKRGVGERRIAWACKCDCGTEIVAFSINLRQGLTKSCGCATPPKSLSTIDGQGNRRCVKCKQYKSPGCFYKTKADACGLSKRCIECEKARIPTIACVVCGRPHRRRPGQPNGYCSKGCGEAGTLITRDRYQRLTKEFLRHDSYMRRANSADYAARISRAQNAIYRAIRRGKEQ